ncbi:MAG: GMC oxidoreductase [Spirosomataceae bacterium]
MSVLHQPDPNTEYDVIIVGSGAGGGMAAYQLAKAGAKVCVLEAGGYFDPADPKYITQLKNPWESPRRGASSVRPFGDFDAAWGGWDIEGEPYEAMPGTDFRWFRSRMLGGRTNHWGRISMRFGPDDFKRGSMTGIGDDWPISYEDLAPYYDKVDQFIGLFGTKEGLPNEPDGIFLPPPKPRLHELMIKKAAGHVNIPVIPSRMAMLTKPINDSRGACFYCGQCNRGCVAYADFSSSSVLCIPAMKTGNMTLINHAMVREVHTDPKTGLATGVSYINTRDRQDYRVRGKMVVLAASACESSRILLNSKSSRFPNGLANDSGVIGKYLNDSTGASRSAFIPSLMDRTRFNEDGVGGMHVYTPWWLDNAKLDFPRGYHIEYSGGMKMPSYGFGMGLERINGTYADKNGNKKRAGGYGAGLKEDVRRTYGAIINMAGRGEPIPLESNYCEIDPNKVDQYGIPTLRFHYKWSEHEIKQAKHMQDTFEQIIHEMGGIPMGPKPDASTNYGLAKPGEIIHEIGTVRMGNDPKKSALNKYQQAHAVKNLFVVDAAPFVSQGDKNVTWTILASAWRTSDYIIDLKKRNEL